MTYIEETGDLFGLDDSWTHCQFISADLDMSRGISPLINLRYNQGQRLAEQHRHYGVIWEEYEDKGDCLYDAETNVASLVISDKSRDIPDYNVVKEAFKVLKGQMELYGLSGLAIPMIGDEYAVRWDRIRGIIQDVFEDTDVKIVVRY